MLFFEKDIPQLADGLIYRLVPGRNLDLERGSRPAHKSACTSCAEAKAGVRISSRNKPSRDSDPEIRPDEATLQL
jgi:hypothetical protein